MVMVPFGRSQIIPIHCGLAAMYSMLLFSGSVGVWSVSLMVAGRVGRFLH